VTHKRPHCKRDAEPAQEHYSEERCPGHTVCIGSKSIAP
jgi:hypothetical protein